MIANHASSRDNEAFSHPICLQLVVLFLSFQRPTEMLAGKLQHWRARMLTMPSTTPRLHPSPRWWLHFQYRAESLSPLHFPMCSPPSQLPRPSDATAAYVG
eukprot:COSAG02_NODE_4078_length_5809_cov_1.830363_8_plen_101_part_00